MTVRDLLAPALRLLCGARTVTTANLPDGPAIYFANHSSHLDFAIVWSCLPQSRRNLVRPVAGRDYWERTGLRRWLALSIFNAVLIERQHVTVANNPMAPMLAALDAGSSLIVFPEGTRSRDGRIQEFKAGLYHLARARPGIPLVPVLLENLNRMLPKGEFLPVPLIASVHTGACLRLQEGESRGDFLSRTRQAVVALSESRSP